MLEVNAPSSTSSAGMFLNTALVASQFSAGMAYAAPDDSETTYAVGYNVSYVAHKPMSTNIHTKIREGHGDMFHDFVSERLISAAQNAFSSLSEQQKVLSEEFQEVLNESLWDLYEE